MTNDKILSQQVKPKLKTQPSLSLLPTHPLSMYFRHFDDERMASDNVLQLMNSISAFMARLSIYLEDEDRSDASIMMQGFQNLLKSMTEFHNHRY